MSKCYVFALSIMILFGLYGCGDGAPTEQKVPTGPLAAPVNQVQTQEEQRQQQLVDKLQSIYTAAIKEAGIREGAKLGPLNLTNKALDTVITFNIDTLNKQNIDSADFKRQIGQMNAGMSAEALIKSLIAAGFNPRTEQLSINVCSVATGMTSVTGAAQQATLGCARYSPVSDEVTRY